MANSPTSGQAAFCGLSCPAPWVLAFALLAACEDSPQDRCVKSRLKVWDAHSEKTPWRISEATGQTRSDFEAKARVWCAQETGAQ